MPCAKSLSYKLVKISLISVNTISFIFIPLSPFVFTYNLDTSKIIFLSILGEIIITRDTFHSFIHIFSLGSDFLLGTLGSCTDSETLVVISGTFSLILQLYCLHNPTEYPWNVSFFCLMIIAILSVAFWGIDKPTFPGESEQHMEGAIDGPSNQTAFPYSTVVVNHGHIVMGGEQQLHLSNNQYTHPSAPPFASLLNYDSSYELLTRARINEARADLPPSYEDCQPPEYKDALIVKTVQQI